MKHTKIICTIGPSSQSLARLTQMIQAGMNVARLNFSHSEYRDHEKLLQAVRAAARKTGRYVAILQDLQGPRIRIGRLPLKGITIKKREKVVLVPEKECAHYKSHEYTPIPVQYAELHKYVQTDGHIFIQDGMIDLKIDRVASGHIYCHVINGGTIHQNKGLNAPGAKIKTNVITAKDKHDLEFGIKHDVDYVALSFVRSARDIQALRRLLTKKSRIKIIAKIERQDAIDHFDEILKSADGIMVARGDLGVEIAPEIVPLLQKEMIMKCLQAAKPVIVATQMLESMVENPRPTRAEAADVANAIIDHADAIMLSAESATGKYPVEAVRTMTAIAREIEQSRFDDLPEDIIEHRQDTLYKSIRARRKIARNRSVARSAVHVGEAINAKVIAVLSGSGNTATLISQLRPQKIKIMVFTDDVTILRQLALVWGVRGLKMAPPQTHKEFVIKAKKMVQQKKFVKKGDAIVVVSGFGDRKGLRAVEAVVV